jgi:hypothetical protein
LPDEEGLNRRGYPPKYRDSTQATQRAHPAQDAIQENLPLQSHQAALVEGEGELEGKYQSHHANG